MDIQSAVYLHNGILVRSKKESTSNTRKNMNKCHKYTLHIDIRVHTLRLFLKNLIGVYLTYNAVFVSCMQQSESVIHIHISIIFPYRLLQNIE